MCPCKENRCWVLYLQNNWIFASRKTLDLCYDEQKKGKYRRFLGKIFWPDDKKIEDLKESIKYPYRNWKETKKYKRLTKLLNSRPTDEELIRYEEKMMFKL